MMRKTIIEPVSRFFLKLRAKNPNGFLALILGGILVLDFLLILSFQLRALNALGPQLREAKDQLATAQNDIQRMPQYQAELTKLRGQKTALEGRVKKREEIPQLVEHISQLASQNHIALLQILSDFEAQKFLVKNPEGTYYRVPIMLEAKGGYHQFGRFMDQLETLGGTEIAELSVFSGAADPDRHAIKLILQVIVLEAVEKEG